MNVLITVGMGIVLTLPFCRYVMRVRDDNRSLCIINKRLERENRLLTIGNSDLRSALLRAQNTSRRGW